MARSQTLKKKVSPSGAWRTAAYIIGVLGFSLCYFFSNPSPPLPDFDEFNRERLHSFAAQNTENETRVVILGDSRTKYGLTIGDDPAERIQDRKTGKTFRFLRITDNQAIFDRFRPLFEDILQAEPHLIVIQQSQFVRNWRRMASVEWARRNLINMFFVWGPLDPSQDMDIDRAFSAVTPAELQFLRTCVEWYDAQSMEILLTQRGLMNYYDLKGPNAQLAAAFVDTVTTQLGIPVVLLGMHDMRPLDEAYNQHHITPVLEPMITQISENPLVTPIIFDTAKAWGKEHYCDLSHFNEDGRKAHTKWFISQITDILKN